MDKEKEAAQKSDEVINLAITENDLKSVSVLYMSCMLRLMGDDVPALTNHDIRARVVHHIQKLAEVYDVKSFGSSQKIDADEE